jgi:hypothetical protein
MYTRARGTSPKRKHKPRGNEQTAGWATTDVQEVGSQPDFRLTFAPIATRLLREMSRKQRLKDRVEHTLAVVKAFSIAVPGAIQLKLEVEAASGVADSGTACRAAFPLTRPVA